MIEIELEELLLPGLHLKPTEAAIVRREVLRQLRRLIEDRGLPPGDLHELPALTLPHTTVRPDDSPWALGRQIAHAIFRHLHQTAARRS